MLLSFSFFAGLLTLLLLAQRTIPERGTESLEPLPTEVVGPSILQPNAQPTEAPPSQSGGTATEPLVLTVPGGPVFVAPVGELGPAAQVNEPAANPEKGKNPAEGKGEPPPAESEQPSPPGGPGPSPPGGDVPSGQPTPPPGVLPPDPDEADDGGSSDEDEDEGEDDDDTDTDDDGGERADDGEGGQKSGKGGSKDDD